MSVCLTEILLYRDEKLNLNPMSIGLGNSAQAFGSLLWDAPKRFTYQKEN